MNEQRTSVIELDDEIVNDEGDTVIVTHTQQGRHGILAAGRFLEGGGHWQSFLVPELPEIERTSCGGGWASRGHIVLATGQRIGRLSIWSHDYPRGATLNDYEVLWLATRGAIAFEPMQSKPLPVGENVARME